MSIENQVLLYVIDKEKNSILLIHKKRGLGKGLINGVGGKVKEGETIEEAVVRECEEEVKITPYNLEKRGVLLFKNNKTEHILVHVFISNSYIGTPEETDEAKPFWCDITSIPYDQMWEDDIYWLPYVLGGLYVYGEFEFENWKLKTYKVYVNSESLSEVVQYLENNAVYCPFFKKVHIDTYLRRIIEEIEEIIKANTFENFKKEIADALHNFLVLLWKLDKEGIISKEEILSHIVKKMRNRKPHVFKRKHVTLKEALEEWFSKKREEEKRDISQELADETKRWLFRLKGTKIKPAEGGEKFAENIKAYIHDAEYFLRKNMLIEAFEAVIWAWSWYEIGKQIGKIK